MMAFRISRLYRLWLLISLKMFPDRLHFVPLFLKLFLPLQVWASLFFSQNLSGYRSGLVLVVPDISFGGGVSPSVCGIGTPVLLLCIFGFKVLRGSRACLIRVRHFL